MSLLNDASLVLVPSGYKEDVVYCQKPTDGSGDLTFSRASTATRVNSAGLIEKGRENLLTYSNDLTQWSPSGVGSTTATTDPLGGNKAFILDDQDAGAFYRIASNTLSITGVVTSSVYIKKTTGSLTNYAGLEFNDESVFVIFDTTNGTYNLTATSPYLFINVETAYDDWWRVSFAVSSFTSGQYGLRLWSAISSDGSTLSASATGSNIFYAPQTEQGLVATDYIETTTAAVSVGITADVPRLDYTNSSCPSLLLEPQRTNLVTQSEYFGDYGGLNASVTTNETTSPEGLENATKVIATGTGGHYIQSEFISYTTSTTYTYSVFAKKSNTSLIQLVAPSGVFGLNVFASYNFDTLEVTEGSSATASMEDYGNGWYRLIMTGTSINSATISSFYLVFTNDKSVRTPSFTANGEEVYIWGAQTEVGSYSTSYLPTYGTSVTRVADAASKTGISSLIGQTEGTLFAEINVNITVINQNIELGDGTSSNRIDLRLNSNNNYQLVIVQGGVVVFNQIAAATFTQGQRIKLAAVYKSGDVTQLFVNGVSVLSATAGTITGNLNAIYSGSIGGTADLINSPVNELIVFSTALTDTQAIELTTI